MAELSVSTYLRIKTTNCITCGVVIGLEASLYDERVRDHVNFFCPNGHSQHFMGETHEEKLKRELEVQRKFAENANKRREWAEQEAKKAKEAETRAKKKLTRVKNGVCPCCNRSFQNLKRHMATKHPEAK